MGPVKNHEKKSKTIINRYKSAVIKLITVIHFSAILASLALTPDLRDVHNEEILYMVIDGIVVLAGGFGLLVIGPSYIPANEVTLFFLVETILGEEKIELNEQIFFN